MGQLTEQSLVGTEGESAQVRAIVADDSVLLREGVVRLLAEAGVAVVAQAGDAAELIRKTRAHKPDVLVVDVRMPPTHTAEGLQAAKALREEFPQLAVFVLSQHAEEHITADLLADNASGFGYMIKDRVVNVGQFLDAFNRVVKGGSAIDPQIVSRMVGRSTGRHALDYLTVRELEVLELMAEGRTNRAIANQMTISVRAAEKHVGSIFQKLELEATPDDHRRVLAVLKYLQRN